MHFESKPQAFHENQMEDEGTSRVARVFFLGLILAGIAGFCGATCFGKDAPGERMVRGVPLRVIQAGLTAAVVGLIVGGPIAALVLDEIGRGLAVGAFASAMGAGIGACMGDPVVGAIAGSIIGGWWSVARLAE